MRVCVVGSGISGLSCAWLLSRAHEVVLFEAAPRLGGHTNTVELEAPDGRRTAVDTGFIVYNEHTYPNLTALFEILGVRTRGSDMSFAVSLDGGRLEYGSTDLRALFAQKRNLLNPKFWSMLGDLRRFYAAAPKALAALDDDMTLGAFLDAGGYGAAFQEAHLLPQAAAIWSSSVADIRAYPASAFIRFFVNHGLLELDVAARPQWRTVVGGSSSYIPYLTGGLASVRVGAQVVRVVRTGDGVRVRTRGGEEEAFDHAVLACHAPEALGMLDDPTGEEAEILSKIRYRPNVAVLHTDPELMPRRRSAWSAWNFVGDRAGEGEVTYWMNRLQGLEGAVPYFVSLNPPRPPRRDRILREMGYEHPAFDVAALKAQKALWTLQGRRRTWFCGAYFGAGFHEDGLQAGLAVAEELGGVARPWTTPSPSGRIFRPERSGSPRDAAQAA